MTCASLTSEILVFVRCREFGIIVFGASGFTGKRVMVEMATTAPGVKWAAAGRSKVYA
jgi:short subunit dehydrogenase-like uncharacterized protein